MSHCHQKEFVLLALSTLTKAGIQPTRILEVGSYDVQGDGGFRSVLKRLPSYQFAELVGVDLVDGPGVDHVVSSTQDRYLDGLFELAVSCEALEHDSNWKQTLLSIRRSLTDSGWLIITTAGKYRPEHGTSRSGRFQSPGTQGIGSDYYGNFSRDALAEGIISAGFESAVVLENREVWDVYAIASVRKRDLDEFATLLSEIKCQLSRPQRLHRLPLRMLQRLLREDRYQVLASRYWFWSTRMMAPRRGTRTHP